MIIKRIMTLAAATALSAGLLAAGSGTALAERAGYRLDGKAGLWGTVAADDRGRSTAGQRATGAAPAQGGVFKTSYSLGRFEQLTGVSMSKTFGSRTWFSHFRGRPTLARDGYNFYINRNNGKIVFRSLSGAPKPFSFDSVFVEVGSRYQRDVAFNWKNPRSLRIAGFPRGPVAVSLN